MSMLDSFFNKAGFKGAKCKTLLKLTIPRIKLLRNRREIQIKQMRRDIAKLLETGQEATARIRVEHIIREENMMAAQEIIELFCELIAVRVPIIETQRECPLDLKEAISSVCFAAPRCADLPELLQVQMLFSSKYGKEFVSAATELMPDCGVNRQLIELLSIRAPPAEVKLKLLKEIAEEHDLDWDPAATETEFFKPHEDLLNGPTQFVSGSSLALPKEKHDETLYSASVEASHEESDSDSGLDTLDLPEVPKVSLRQIPASGSAPQIVPPPLAPPVFEHKSTKSSGGSEDVSYESHQPDPVMQERFVVSSVGSVDNPISKREDKQFLPFISPPPSFSATVLRGQNEPVHNLSRTKSELNVDLKDVLAAAQSAADSAERAAAAARSAASLAEVRISELMKRRNDSALENSEHAFHSEISNQAATVNTPQFDHQQSFGGTEVKSYSSDPLPDYGPNSESEPLVPTFDKAEVECVSPRPDDQVLNNESIHHQPQRLTSMEDDPYFSYPNLFTRQESNLGSGNHSDR